MNEALQIPDLKPKKDQPSAKEVIAKQETIEPRIPINAVGIVDQNTLQKNWETNHLATKTMLKETLDITEKAIKRLEKINEQDNSEDVLFIKSVITEIRDKIVKLLETDELKREALRRIIKALPP